MKRLFIIFSILAFTTLNSAGAKSANLSQIAFMGDSLTVGLGRSGELSEAAIFGVMGENSGQLRKRFSRQISHHHYKAVVILIGINDIAGGRNASWTIANLTAMYEEATKAGLKVIACTLPPWGAYINRVAPQRRATAANWLNKTSYINYWIRSQKNILVDQVIDLNILMANPQKPNHTNPLFLEPDLLHFNLTGSRTMARYIKQGLNI